MISNERSLAGLANLAAQIRQEHQAATLAIRRGCEHAIAAGRLLIEAKGQIPHGQWLLWLKESIAKYQRAQRRPICRSPTWPRMRNAFRGIGAAIMRMIDARGFVINCLQSCYSPTCRQKTRPIPSSSPPPATLAWSPLGPATGETSAAVNRCSTAPAIGYAQAQTLPPPSSQLGRAATANGSCARPSAMPLSLP
jgi:hypothetical protein